MLDYGRCMMADVWYRLLGRLRTGTGDSCHGNMINQLVIQYMAALGLHTLNNVTVLSKSGQFGKYNINHHRLSVFACQLVSSQDRGFRAEQASSCSLLSWSLSWRCWWQERLWEAPAAWSSRSWRWRTFTWRGRVPRR